LEVLKVCKRVLKEKRFKKEKQTPQPFPSLFSAQPSSSLSSSQPEQPNQAIGLLFRPAPLACAGPPNFFLSPAG
jgi:hypothetical protein